MDIKSLLKKLPNFSELVEKIENELHGESIFFINDLNIESMYKKDSFFIVLCRYRENENINTPKFIHKVIDKEVLNAYSNSYLESIALKNDLLLFYVGEQKQGFCLAVLTRKTVNNEQSEQIEVSTNDVESIDNQLVDFEEEIFILQDDTN